MSAQRFAATELASGEWVVLFNQPANFDATVSVFITNSNPNDNSDISNDTALVSLALAETQTPETVIETTDVFLLNIQVPSTGSIEQRHIVVPGGFSLAANANRTNVNILVFGYSDAS